MALEPTVLSDIETQAAVSIPEREIRAQWKVPVPETFVVGDVLEFKAFKNGEEVGYVQIPISKNPAAGQELRCNTLIRFTENAIPVE